MEWNNIHISQARPTPIRDTENWAHTFNFKQVSDESILEVLNNIIKNSQSLPHAMKDFLVEIRRNKKSPMMPNKLVITKEKFQQLYKRTPEKRSASPLGLHISHWKAMSRIWSSILDICVSNMYILQR